MHGLHAVAYSFEYAQHFVLVKRAVGLTQLVNLVLQCAVLSDGNDRVQVAK